MRRIKLIIKAEALCLITSLVFIANIVPRRAIVLIVWLRNAFYELDEYLNH